ncbi:hypothetical protein SH528x_007312 [Novipirellula sp. SH528]|uniref:hypothetical protein n=1 Tax=Novipirellula sp. SH528 TaxID=3454466 RepID=UPI003FA08050
MQVERPQTRVEEKQGHLANMVRMIAQSKYHSLLCTGFGGGGKSRVVTNILRDEGQEMIVYNSHCTTLQLYRLLYSHAQDSEKILVFDDCDEIYKSGPALGILRSALFGQPDRVVTYNSSTLPPDLPARFETQSRFIFLANKVPKKCPIFDAVVSRCLVYRMDLSNAEIIEQFRAMTLNGYPGCPPEAAEEIVDFIEEHGDEKQLSMRLLTPAIRIYKFCVENNTDWRPVVLAQMQNLGRPVSATKRLNNHEQQERLLAEAQAKFPDSVAEQQQYFCDRTKKSRATFYRAINRLKKGS